MLDMGSTFKSRFEVTKNENDKAKQDLQNVIAETLAKVKALDVERQAMLIQYNKLTTSIFQFNAEIDNNRRKLKRLNAPNRNSDAYPLDDSDID